jgi:hypothetical protein
MEGRGWKKEIGWKKGDGRRGKEWGKEDGRRDKKR